MFTPRSIFILLVVAHVAGRCLNEILDGFSTFILIPFWRELVGSTPAFRIGDINVGAFIGTVVLSLTCLAAGVTLVVVLIRMAWPWLAEKLALETHESQPVRPGSRSTD
jgi:hypothetical protein